MAFAIVKRVLLTALLLAVGTAGFLLFRSASTPETQINSIQIPAEANLALNQAVSRANELKKLSPNEVVQRYGQPTSRKPLSETSEEWKYDRTSPGDADIELVISNDKVLRVKYKQ